MKAGDRVKLIPSHRWLQPYRGWAERGRAATVLRAFQPQGSNQTTVVVKFDGTRVKGAAGEHPFAPHDLLIIKDDTP